MFTGPDFVSFVEQKLQEHGVGKVVPDAATLKTAWRRAHINQQVNAFIERISNDSTPVPALPDDLAQKIRDSLDHDPTQSWDEALWALVGDEDEGWEP
jgi:hypothetical protein